MNGRQLLIVLVIVGAGFYLYTHSGNKSAAPSNPPGDAPSSAQTKGFECVRLAEEANAALRDASMLLMKPPVDPGAWSSAESRVSSAISAAESACPGGDPAQDAVKTALSLMRASVSDLSSAARGAGGANDLARRQGEIDQNLDRARAAR